MDCIVFNELSDLISIDSTTIDKLTSPEFSLTFDIYIDNDIGKRTLVSKYRQFSISVIKNEINIASDWTWSSTGVFINLKTWTRVAVTYNYNSKKCKIYIDGKLCSEKVLKGDFIINNYPVEFGLYIETDVKLIKLSKIGLYVKELSAKEVINLVNGDY